MYRMPYDENEEEEATIAAIEAHPWSLSAYDESLQAGNDQAREAFHIATACRTIVSAARGGQLKRLAPDEYSHQYPFRIRALLPYWVRIEDWGAATTSRAEGWIRAAVSLRSFLAHASLHKDWSSPTSGTKANVDRLLTREDLRRLLVYFANAERSRHWHKGGSYESVVEKYLPWMTEDVELGHQVLDTWKIVAESGQADMVTGVEEEYW